MYPWVESSLSLNLYKNESRKEIYDVLCPEMNEGGFQKGGTSKYRRLSSVMSSDST